jgi:hypothetical protein
MSVSPFLGTGAGGALSFSGPGGSPFGGETAFGFSIPQGAPDAIAAAGRAVQQLQNGFEDQLRRMRTAVGAADGEGAWTGPAATAFVVLTTETVAAISTNQRACSEAASALRGLSDALETAQRTTKQAAEECERAQADLSTANARAESAAQEAADATTRASASVHPDQAAHWNAKAAQAHSERAAAESDAADAQAALTQAERNGRQAEQTYIDAARGFTSAITGAADQLREVPLPHPGDSGKSSSGARSTSAILPLLSDTNKGVQAGGSVASLGTLPFTGKAVTGLASALRADSDLNATLDRGLSTLMRAYADGEVTPNALTRAMVESAVLRTASAGQVSKELNSVAASGLDRWPVGVTRTLAGLAVLGDIGTLVDPGASGAEGTVNRVAAGANIAGTAVASSGELDVVASLNAGDEIPVYGEVVAVGSGVYLAGDFVYDERHAIGHFFDSFGHDIASVFGGGPTPKIDPPTVAEAKNGPAPAQVEPGATDSHG